MCRDIIHSMRAQDPGPSLLPRDGELPVLAEEFVEGLSEQGLDRAILHDAEQAQLAVDSREKSGRRW